ncbi:hypothetical protein ACFLZN_01400 [Nanoarchaeota archaeon]
MLTKTQLKILEFFTSQITEKFSIKQVSEQLKKPYPLIHRSVQDLLKKEYLNKDKHGFLRLDYKKHNAHLAYVESLRSEVFLKKNKVLQLFVKDAFGSIKQDFFILLVFGSAVVESKPRDIDILCIVPNEDLINNVEKTLINISERFTKNFDINVIASVSVHEMLLKRDEANVINETINKHIVLFGAENYYHMLKNAR